MHFFRIKIKGRRSQRRPPLDTDQGESSTISGQRVREPSPITPPRRFRNSVWQLLPFVGKVSTREIVKYECPVNQWQLNAIYLD